MWTFIQNTSLWCPNALVCEMTVCLRKGKQKMQSFGKPWLCMPQTPGRHLHKYCLHTNKTVYTEVEKKKINLKAEALCRSQAPALQLLQGVIIEIITAGTVLKEKKRINIFAKCWQVHTLGLNWHF